MLVALAVQSRLRRMGSVAVVVAAVLVVLMVRAVRAVQAVIGLVAAVVVLVAVALARSVPLARMPALQAGLLTLPRLALLAATTRLVAAAAQGVLLAEQLEQLERMAAAAARAAGPAPALWRVTAALVALAQIGMFLMALVAAAAVPVVAERAILARPEHLGFMARVAVAEAINQPMGTALLAHRA